MCVSIKSRWMDTSMDGCWCSYHVEWIDEKGWSHFAGSMAIGTGCWAPTTHDWLVLSHTQQWCGSDQIFPFDRVLEYIVTRLLSPLVTSTLMKPLEVIIVCCCSLYLWSLCCCIFASKSKWLVPISPFLVCIPLSITLKEASTTLHGNRTL